MRETECRKIFDIDYDNYEADNRVYSVDGVAPTLITRLNERGFWVFAVDTYNKAIHEDCFQTITTGVSFRNHDYIGEMEMKREEDKPEVLAGIGERKSNGGTQWYEQSRIYDSDKVATAIPAEQSFHPFYGGNLRVRKLTPCECLRLMAFTREDYLSLVGEGGRLDSRELPHRPVLRACRGGRRADSEEMGGEMLKRDGMRLIRIEYMDPGCEIRSEDIKAGEGITPDDIRKRYEDDGIYEKEKGGDGE
jgi:hypothetical protein